MSCKLLLIDLERRSSVVVPVDKGTRGQPATMAQLAPLWPPASQNHIPSRGSPDPPAIPDQSSSR